MRYLHRVAVDFFLLASATPLAFLIRRDFDVAAVNWSVALWVTLFALVLKGGAYAALRLHTRSWRKVTFQDLSALLWLAGIGTAGLLPVALVFDPPVGPPRSIPLIDGALTLLVLCGARAGWRYLAVYRQVASLNASAPPSRVLIVGAGEAGALIVREMFRHPQLRKRPVAIVDDDPHKHGQRLSGVPVMGGIERLSELIDTLEVDEVVIAIAAPPGKLVQRVIASCDGAKRAVRHQIVPGLYELISGKIGIQRMRDVRIEDLLGRESVELDTGSIEDYLRGQTVLVTGAGGSIGSELVRQLCAYAPAQVILFGRGENGIFKLERQLDKLWPTVPYTSVIGDVRSRRRLEKTFARYKPSVVFHAAAHKHVPLMEANPEEAIANNVFGTRNVAELALEHGVRYFVNISTDKAVNPTSVMDASKRLAECVVQSAATKADPEQRFVSVRFGNVLGSRGSVVPLFQEQLRRGGPLTVTHPEMTRYFMTIPEAVQLVLQAAALGENGHIYILDMGEPVKIKDLAAALIHLSGFKVGEEIAIEYTGVRPGEKLYEELMGNGEREANTPHEKIFVARHGDFDPARLQRTLTALEQAVLQGDEAAIRQQLRQTVDGYRPPERLEVA